EQTLTQTYHTVFDIVRGQHDLRTYLAAISRIGDVTYKCLSSILDHRRLMQSP
ncbi:unnamed protein product, partial [Ilex paraguariensis]